MVNRCVENMEIGFSHWIRKQGGGGMMLKHKETITSTFLYLSYLSWSSSILYQQWKGIYLI
jgi:hypothetical protein